MENDERLLASNLQFKLNVKFEGKEPMKPLLPEEEPDDEEVFDASSIHLSHG